MNREKAFTETASRDASVAGLWCKRRAAFLENASMPAADVCHACRSPITAGGIISFDSVKYHADCFRCQICSASLAPSSHGKSPGVHLDPSKRPMCVGCWTKNFAERCAACRIPFDSKQQIVLFDGKKLHVNCFRCSGPCGQVLGDGAQKGENRKFHRQDGKPYCANCHTELFAPRCAACARPIEAGTRYMVHKGKKLHPACFCCAECGSALDGAEHYERDGAVYCAADYRNRFGQECAICKQRLLSWIATEAGETYCAKHEKDSPPCHGCGRLVAPGSGGTDLADGRVSCASCSATAIHSEDDARRILHEVRRFFVDRGVDVPPADAITLELCERSQLLARNGTGGGHGGTGGAPAFISSHRYQQCPLGLTCAEETTTTTTRIDGAGRKTVLHPPSSGNVSRTVRCVCVLKGLPREVFASTLAHELGHVFLHLAADASSGARFDSMSVMPPSLAEGLCELFAYLWLTEHSGGEPLGAVASAGSPLLPPAHAKPRQPPTEPQSVRTVRVKAMLSNTDAVYGDGFRAALAAYYAVGSSLPKLLDEVRRTKRLPGGGSAANGRLPAAGSPARLLRPGPTHTPSPPSGVVKPSPRASPAGGTGTSSHAGSQSGGVRAPFPPGATVAGGGAAAAAAMLAGGAAGGGGSVRGRPGVCPGGTSGMAGGAGGSTQPQPRAPPTTQFPTPVPPPPGASGGFGRAVAPAPHRRPAGS